MRYKILFRDTDIGWILADDVITSGSWLHMKNAEFHYHTHNGVDKYDRLIYPSDLIESVYTMHIDKLA